MESDELSEVIRTHLPAYLSEEDYYRVTKQLADYSEFSDYYLVSAPTNKVLQGDCWTGFPIVDGEERIRVHGVILSNSCDIDPDNSARLNKNVIFTPVIQLNKVRELYAEAGFSSERIKQNIDLVKRQLISDIFYLPSYGDSVDDHVVRLDNVYTTSISDFQRQERERIFCLGQTAFYIFLIKLSIHFTRLREGVRRFND